MCFIRKPVFQSILLILMVNLNSISGFTQVKPARIFGEGMVLQRNVEIPVFGTAPPGFTVYARFNGHKANCVTDIWGNWRMSFPPMEAGGPFELIIEDLNPIVLKDIYVGEVWLCGGQSNMQYTLDMLGIDPATAAHPVLNILRFYNVDIDWDVAISDDIKGGKWENADAEHAGHLSALAFYFGKYLQDSLKVPVGLISSNMGATSIETWMSKDALLPYEAFRAVIETTLSNVPNKSVSWEQFEKYRKYWDDQYYLQGKGMEEEWYLPEVDKTDWQEMIMPGLWQHQGLDDHHGVVWFFRSFDQWPTLWGDEPYVALNQIDDYDIVWLNGVKIGEGFGSRSWRRYEFDRTILKDRGNELVVRVFDIGGKGGMYSHPFWGNEVLNGVWKYKKGQKIDPETFPVPYVPTASFFTHPSVLYNANIAPLAPYALKGVIWYQGESNETKAVEYRSLLQDWIHDWRNTWRNDTMPMYIVQLANYRAEDSLYSGVSQWAEIREAQYIASLLPSSGIATAIDIGDANDIHPFNKKDLGQRLAWVAMRRSYGNKLAPISPVYKSVKKINGKMVIHLETFGHSMKDVESPSGFIIAGSDRKFHKANAVLKNGQLVVWSEVVSDPESVRYGWADNPGKLMIYNDRGLPLLPFRTDVWPLTTEENVFIWDPWGF
ncbi:MAG TPA: sialate O-acetylesterase [Saprospiraceae bacterium]|nr:sialate O-acetylesterase [Saprospiraceae bacterium]